MEHEQPVVFGPFRIDPVQQQLWQGEKAVALQPRPLAVLQYLIAHADQVVSKDELLREVWTGVYVTKAALKVAVRAIRKALGEAADAPSYIETVGREGYRFVDPRSLPVPLDQRLPAKRRLSDRLWAEKQSLSNCSTGMRRHCRGAAGSSL